jgi:hypothetical protein
MSETRFDIARKIGASWKSSARIRPLNFHKAPNFRVKSPALCQQRSICGMIGTDISAYDVRFVTGDRFRVRDLRLGMIPVTARVGGTGWKTSLFPKDGRYVVPVKASVRKAEGLEVGDMVAVPPGRRCLSSRRTDSGFAGGHDYCWHLHTREAAQRRADAFWQQHPFREPEPDYLARVFAEERDFWAQAG